MVLDEKLRGQVVRIHHLDPWIYKHFISIHPIGDELLQFMDLIGALTEHCHPQIHAASLAKNVRLYRRVSTIFIIVSNFFSSLILRGGLFHSVAAKTVNSANLLKAFGQQIQAVLMQNVEIWNKKEQHPGEL